MGNKSRVRSRKLKNRGGEKLCEWRILNTSSGLHNTSNAGCDGYTNGNTNHIKIEKSEHISGRRIIDINYFIKQLKEISAHAPQFGCTFINMDLKCEVKRGLRCGFLFQCNMCGITKTAWSEDIDDKSVMNVNSAAVAGVISSGGGYSCLETFMGALNIRCMNYKTFDKHQNIVASGWEISALEEMKKAAHEEICLAKDRGDVDDEGVPLLTVVADGSWAKRSYRTNYNSLSGVAAILGYHSKKVLYFGVKNKYCVTCARAANKNSPVKEHKCFKNWSGSSSSMEAAIIVEGFLCSEEMYGVKYAKLIADGDSNVYHNIISARPYDKLTVVKVECRNHLLRNFCNKLKDITSTSVRSNDPDFDRGTHLKLRRILGANILRCRIAVTKAVLYRKKDIQSQWISSQHLRKDIINAPSHIFGEHLRCQELGYFCKGPTTDETNHIPAMKKLGLYSKIMEAVNTLADYSQHLIQDVDSNFVENYNSVVAKLIGGKRVNYTQKGSYLTRCAAAVVRHNTGEEFYKLHKTVVNYSPIAYSKLYERRSSHKIRQASERKKPIARRKLAVESKNNSQHYGPYSQKPDLEEHLFQTKLLEHLNALKKTADEVKQIEMLTRNQHENQLWFEERRLRLTASNFGTVCNRKPQTKCGPLVKRLLYSTDIDTTATRYGKLNESKALEQLVSQFNLNISKCGLFIDREYPFLAASPDGLINDGEGIVEIKCPATGTDLTPNEVIDKKLGLVGNMWNKTANNTLSVKKMHTYHLQVQGQLHITKRKYCLFTIWTPKGIRVEKLSKDDQLWEEVMQPRLEKFYMTCLLPELIDPRHRRNMPIREPDHILKVREEITESKSVALKRKKT